MNALLILEDLVDEKLDYKSYDIVYTTNINLMHKNIVKIDLFKYFMHTHKLCRKFNKKILMLNNSNLMLSLLKMGDKTFFTYLRYIVIAKELKQNNSIDQLTIACTNINLLKECSIIMEENINELLFYQLKVNKLKDKFIVKLISVIGKLLANLFKNIESNFKITSNNLLVTFDAKQSYENVFEYHDVKTLLYPGLTDSNTFRLSQQDINKAMIKNKTVTLKQFISFFINVSKNIFLIRAWNMPKATKYTLILQLCALEKENVYFESILDYIPSIRFLIGQFDAYSPVDYITYRLNKRGVRTICLPHGVNYKYKVNYISEGVDYYAFWSKNHIKQFNDNVLVSNARKHYITGHIGYRELLFEYEHKKHKYLHNHKSILVVGEYFSNNDYYVSPFNAGVSHRFFKALKLASDTYNLPVTIRTRLNDGYYECAKEYLGDRIQLSSPEKKIFDDIMEHDLIISVFSNALHEALLLQKKVLQVNFLGIENYRDLSLESLVYYCEDEQGMHKVIDDYVNDALKDLDFKRHQNEYCNNAKYKKIKPEETL